MEKQWQEQDLARQQQVSLQREQANLENLLDSLGREISKLQQEQKETRAAADTGMLLTQQSEVHKQLSGIAVQRDQREAAVQRRDALREQAASLKGANEAMIRESEPITARKDTLQAADQPLCPTCGQTLTPDHRHRLVEQLEQELESRREKFRSNRSELQGFEEELRSLDAEIRQFDFVLENHPALEKRLVKSRLRSAMQLMLAGAWSP